MFLTVVICVDLRQGAEAAVQLLFGQALASVMPGLMRRVQSSRGLDACAKKGRANLKELQNTEQSVATKTDNVRARQQLGPMLAFALDWIVSYLVSHRS